MPNFKRLVAQVHDIDADDPGQADQIARIRADAINAGMRALGQGTAWAPSIADAVSGTYELLEILADAYVLEEVDDDPERYPYAGYIPIEGTTVPERLIAWRDAAVKAALAAAVPATVLDDLTSIREDATASLNGQAYEMTTLRRIRSTACRIAHDITRARGPQ